MLAKLIRPFHFKIFFSNKYVHASVLDKVTNVAVASISSNNRAFAMYLGESACKNNEQACELLARMLAHKVRERQVRARKAAAVPSLQLSASTVVLYSITQARRQLQKVPC